MARVRESILTPGLRGRVGEAVFVPGATGTQVRRRPVFTGAPSDEQRAAALRMARIAAFWSRVDLAGVGAWRAYAESLEASKPALERRPMPSWNAFLALSTRLLMIDPVADLPLLPPSVPFAGDGVRVTLGSPSPDGSFGRGGRGERLPEPPPPLPTASCACSQGTSLLKTSHLEEGVTSVLFRADRANAPGVVTELMLQPLASVGRAPVPSRYRSRGFVAFAEGSLTAEVPCAPGWVAAAVRFVDAGTGQATAALPLGIVRVE